MTKHGSRAVANSKSVNRTGILFALPQQIPRAQRGGLAAATMAGGGFRHSTKDNHDHLQNIIFFQNTSFSRTPVFSVGSGHT